MGVDEMTIRTIRETVQKTEDRRTGMLALADALEQIQSKAGRTVGLNEYWNDCTSVNIPAAQILQMAAALKKELAALNMLGDMAAEGITLGGKIALYETALRLMRLEQAERLEDAITWTQFKAELSKTITEMAIKQPKN